MIDSRRWVATALGILAASACTALPPPPEAGNTGGSLGIGGVGGRAGTAGSGGFVGECRLQTLEEAGDLEVGDEVEAGLAIGAVCAGGCATPDALDQWSIRTCGGRHIVRLTWDDPNDDLDLFLLRTDESLVDQATGSPMRVSDTEVYLEVVGDLAADTPYLIEVRPGDTRGIPQAYFVGLTRDE